MPPVPVKLSAARPPGTTPRATAPASATVIQASPTAKARARILAVDDTPEALRQLRESLKAVNAECFSCGSGASAIEFLSKELVDVAIVDTTMPGMDGFEVLRAIKHDPRTADIPVLLMTGAMKSEDTHRGVELGAFDYLTKPVDAHECVPRIHAALQVKRLHDELKAQAMDPDEQKRLQAELKQKMLDFANGMTTAHWQKRFGQLTASFLDDIQHPLAHAVASLQIQIVDERLPEEVRQRLMLMHTQFSKVNAHLRRLLSVAIYSRSAQLVRPAEVVSNMLKLLEPEFAYFGIALDQQLDPTVQWWGMGSELSRAVLYLIHNAVEAHTERGPVIKTRFEDETEPEPIKDDPNKLPVITTLVARRDNSILIQIRDNGPGIPAALQDKIWDPYFTTKTPPHTGAGLHLARAIIRANGGDIELKSPGPDCATQFTIVLPVNIEEELYSAEVEPEAEPVAAAEAEVPAEATA